MSQSILTKSIVYLTAVTGVGWVLMQVTEPKKDKLKKIAEPQSVEHMSDVQKRRYLIVQKIRQSARVEEEEPPKKK